MSYVSVRQQALAIARAKDNEELREIGKELKEVKERGEQEASKARKLYNKTKRLFRKDD